MKNTLPYFSHDNDSFSHPKMQALVAEYGMAGYGMFWVLNESIAQSEEVCLNISRKVNKLCLANKLLIKPAELDHFLGFLADPEIDLINYADGIITTDRTTENYRIVKEKREVDRLRKREEREAEKEGLKVESVSGRKVEKSAWKDQQSKAEQKRVNEKKAAAAAAVDSKKDTLDLAIPTQPQLPPDFEVIKTQAARIGIKLDHLSIQRIAQSGIPTQYINGCDGKHTFFDFIIQKIKNRYKDEEIRNLTGLFVMATGWDDMRELYPAWCEEEVRKEGKEKKEHERQIALFNKPKRLFKIFLRE